MIQWALLVLPEQNRPNIEMKDDACKRQIIDNGTALIRNLVFKVWELSG
jgi:hypothetical protein